MAFTLERLVWGARYLVSGAVTTAPLWIAAALVLARALRGPERGRARLLVTVVFTWSAYVVVIGGDIFPAWRHLVPALVVLAFAIAEGAKAMIASSRSARFAAWFGAPILVTGTALFASADSDLGRARSERWEWDGAVVGPMIARAYARERPLLAADPAGCMAYFSQLPVIDMLGLNDRHIARHRPPDFGRRGLGHELGDGRYVLEREPDLVLMCRPTGSPYACFRSGFEMMQDPRFTQRYRLVSSENEGPRGVRTTIWARLEGGRIGVRRDDRRVVIPGALLAPDSAGVARPGPDGRLEAVVNDHSAGAYSRLALPAGRWRVLVQARGNPVAAEVRTSGDTLRLAHGIEPGPFSVSGSRVDLILRSRGDARVASVAFERVGE